MPAYNSAKTIKSSILSVIDQTYSGWELIIVDDCSTDNTVNIVKQLARSDQRIKLVIQQKNSGAGAARNKAIELSLGRFIAFLDSDDMWHPEKLTKQIAFMLDSQVSFSYTRYQVLSESGVLKQLYPPKQATYFSILKTNYIGCLTAIYDTEFFGKVYMPTIRKRQDMALWLELLKQIDKAPLLDECLATYRVGVGMTSNKVKAAQAQYFLYRHHLKLSLLKSLYYMATYTIHGIIKHR
jgi:glycosyltransferase involved in cell wall biosynthesis